MNLHRRQRGDVPYRYLFGWLYGGAGALSFAAFLGLWWVLTYLADAGTPQKAVVNSPDNLPHSAHGRPASFSAQHSVSRVRTPKMPGEPRRVEPSKDRSRGTRDSSR